MRKVGSSISDAATSARSVLRGIRLCILVLRAIYSASIADKTTCLWSLDCQSSGHSAREMTNPVQDLMHIKS